MLFLLAPQGTHTIVTILGHIVLDFVLASLVLSAFAIWVSHSNEKSRHKQLLIEFDKQMQENERLRRAITETGVNNLETAP